MKKEVLVIGGGPAGMMAAISAGEKGHSVTLIEKNKELGKKLLITGNGRCNITNSAGPEELLSHIRSNGKFLNHGFRVFSNFDVMDFFHREGLKTIEEEGCRIFPISNKASDVREVLLKNMKEKGVKILKDYKVEELLIENGRIQGVRGNKGVIKGDYVVLVTGGMSYANTGSDGLGFLLAQKAGHKIIEPRPGLCPLKLKGNWWKDLQGIALKKCKISRSKKEVVEGDILFTHFGISGPGILGISGLLNKGDTIYVDMAPNEDEETIREKLEKELKDSGSKLLRTAIQKNLDQIPKEFWRSCFTFLNIPWERRMGDLKKEERERLIRGIKALPLDVAEPMGFNQAMITKGGVSVKEIDPKTMESRIVKGLRFAGEIIDLDGDTGGYNLQIAWSTGWLAGSIE